MIKLTIYDKITMQHCYAAEAVDYTCRDILGIYNQNFNRIIVVLGRDFQQITPVIPKKTQEMLFLYHCYGWFLGLTLKS